MLKFMSFCSEASWETAAAHTAHLAGYAVPPLQKLIMVKWGEGLNALHFLCRFSSITQIHALFFMHILGALALLLRLHKGIKSSEEQASNMCTKKRHLSRVQNVEEADYEANNLCVLDLPELVLEEILRRLDPRSLCKTAVTCKQLWELCGSDRLWEPLLQEKWGKVIGPTARAEWQINNSSICITHGGSTAISIENRVRKVLVWPFLRVWPFAGAKSKSSEKVHDAHLSDSVMACYGALETGAFCFPAQVYNREHGHVGFLLSCYDAEVSYDRKTDTFKARYPPHGSRTTVTEEGVQWKRLRPPPTATSPHELHLSDCLDVLRPGDHVEVQWRRNKGFPYGWWYGVVGHSEVCTPETRHCFCHLDATVWLEFNQYTVGSRWRRAAVNRETHREEGNEAEGFYAGIRKLQLKGEISVWKQHWPRETLD